MTLTRERHGTEGAERVEHGVPVDALWGDLNRLRDELDTFAQLTEDRVLPMADAAFGQSQGLLTLTVAGQSFFLTPHARNQLAGVVGLPTTFLDRCSQYRFPDLAADALNTFLRRTKERRRDWSMLFRLRFPEHSRPTVRAALSTSYGVFNNREALDMLLENLPNEWGEPVPLTSYGDADTVRGTLLFPATVAAREGDSDYYLGLYYRNSEIGDSAFGVCPFLFRAYCTNTAIWGRRDAGAPDVKVVHLGDMGPLRKSAIKNSLLTGLELARENSPNLLRLLGYTRAIPSREPEPVIAALCRRHGWSPVVAEAWRHAWQVEPASTAFALVNGLTRAAQAFTGEERLELEVGACAILAPAITADEGAVQNYWGEHRAAAARLSPKALRKYFPPERPCRN